MKTNSKLVGIISTLLVVGFLVTSFASFYASRRSLRTEIETSSLPLTGDNIYSEIQRDLLKPVFISSLMATDTFLRDWMLSGEPDQSNIIRYLKEIQERYNTFTAFLVSDKSRQYYHANGLLKSVNAEDPRDAWYFRVRQMEEDYEINVDADMANEDAMTIFVNYRVYDYAGNFIGVTGVGLTVSAVKERIEEYQKKYGRNIYFITGEGELKLAGTDFPQGLSNIHEKKNFPSFAALKDGSNSYYRYLEGNTLIHVNIRYIHEFNWFLVVEQSETQTTKPLLNTLFINLAICLTVTFIVIVFVYITINAYQKNIETLRGIVPICSYCKQIRDDEGFWNQVEAYVSRHTEARFSHSICPDCMQKHFPNLKDQ